MPKISIIVPVYNVAQYLDRCFSSISHQTFKDFEVIIINDGSTDDSGLICDRWSKEDPRFKVFHQENAGVGEARNSGLRHSSGDYIYSVDPDDWVELNVLGDNYNLAIETNADMVFFGYFKEQIVNGFQITNPIKLEAMHLRNRNEIEDRLSSYLNNADGYSMWTKLIKRDLIQENSLQFLKMVRGEDISFSIELFKYCKSIAMNPNCYYHYNTFSGTNKYDSNVIANHLYLYNKIYELFDQWPNSLPNMQYLRKLFILWFCYVVPANIIFTDKLSYKQKLSNLKLLLNNADIQKYASALSEIPSNTLTRLLLKLIKTRNTVLLYYAVKLMRFQKSRSNSNFKKSIN